MSKYTCLLIDLDGTLLDFEKAEKSSLEKTFHRFSLPVSEENYEKYYEINKALWRAFERGEIEKEKLVVKRFKDLLAYLNCDGNAEEINTFYLTELSKCGDAYEGALEFLEKIMQNYTIAIATNGVSRTQQGRVKASNLSRFIDFLITSEDANAAKPEIAFFTYAMEIIGQEEKESVLMIGDSLLADIQGGINFGIDTCWYNPEKLLPPNDINPTYTAVNYTELLHFIESGGIE